MEGNKFEVAINFLKQPSTVKGILGLVALAGLQFAPEQFSELVDGIATLYFLIAIFWQKS